MTEAELTFTQKFAGLLRDRRVLSGATAVLLILGIVAIQPSKSPAGERVATGDRGGAGVEEGLPGDPAAPGTEAGGGSTARTGSRSSRTGTTGGGSGSGASGPYKGEVGVTKDSITIGAIYPQSGAFAALTTQYAKVFRAAFNDLNDREGGVYKRKLLLEPVDEGETTNSALAAARQIAPKVFGYTTFLQETVEADYAEANRIPALTLLGNITPGGVNGQYRYSFQVGTPPGYYATRNAPSFLHAKFPNLIDRTVFVTGEIYPSAEEAFRSAAGRHSVNVVHVETLAINQAQCFNSAQNVIGKTPKVVMVIAGPLEAGCFFRDAKTAGLTAQMSTLLNIPQNAASGGADTGVPGIVPYFPLESDEGRKMIATYKKYHPNEEVTFPANDRAWASAQMWIQWLKALGPEPTRAAFPGMVETGTVFANGFDGPQKFSREIHVGSEHTIAGVQATGTYTITDPVWRKTYDGIEDPPFSPFKK